MKRILIVAVVGHIFFLSHPVTAQKIHHPQEGHYLNNLLNASLLFDTTHVAVRKPAAAVDSISDAWKKWRTVKNYSFGKNRGAMPMITDLKALHPYFRDQVIELVRRCKAAGIRLAIVESYRTPSKQAEYFAMGRKYTASPGGKSRHQYGLAVDVVPMVNSVAIWNNPRLWKKIGMIGESLGLRWGGRWRVLYDPGHFEWSAGLSKEELEQGIVPQIPSAVIDKYPNLDADLRQLRVYWDAWEVEQSMSAGVAHSHADESAGVGQ